MNFGPEKFLFIGVVAILLFGPNQLPEFARMAGKGLSEFRKLRDLARADFADVFDELLVDHDTSDEPAGPGAVESARAASNTSPVSPESVTVDLPGPHLSERPETPSIVPVGASPDETTLASPQALPVNVPEVVDLDDTGFPRPKMFS